MIDYPPNAGTSSLCEQFASEEAFKAHTESAHFKELVLGDAVHRLAERRRDIFETI